MTNRTFIVADFGASSGRVIAGEFDGQRISLNEVHRFSNTPVKSLNILYWDILQLYSGLKEGIRKAAGKHKNAISIGIDTWGLDVGFIDRHSLLLANPVSYKDERRSQVSSEVYNIISHKDIFLNSAFYPNPGYTLFHLFALKQDERYEYLYADRCLMMPDLFNLMLTGEVSTEHTNLTTTLMYNQKEKRLSTEVFEKLDLNRSLIPEIIYPGHKLGCLRQSVRSELELPELDVIAVASHDTASAVTAIPFHEKNDSRAFISTGTICIIGMEMPEIVITDDVYDAGFGYNSGVDDSVFISKHITGFWIIEQCRQRWMRDSGETISWQEIVSEIAEAAPFKSFVDIEDEVFVSLDFNMPGKVREYCRDTGQPVPETRPEVSRCIYESMVMKFRHYLGALENVTARKIDTIHLVGGGSENERVCQWTANVTGSSILAGPAECTAAGNMITQMKGNRQINSVSEGRNIIMKSFPVKHYSPEEQEQWGEYYQAYKRIIGS